MFIFTNSILHSVGAMKTYWLEKREQRSKIVTVTEPVQWSVKSCEKRVSTTSFTSLLKTNSDCISRRESRVSSTTPTGCNFLSDERRMYSPITFQDVARRSVANSPTKTIDGKGNNFLILISRKKIEKKKFVYNCNFHF